jgi:hypothetical protein
MTGQKRSSRILPEPLYCRSDLTTLLGVADLVIYVINHAFRPAPDWTRPVQRTELIRYADRIYKLQRSVRKEGEFAMWTVFHMDDLRPYSQRIGKSA